MRTMADPAELTCQELVEVVTEYLEGTLVPEERARFERHLAGCPHCRVYVEQMRQAIRALGQLVMEGWPPEDREVLLAHFRAWQRDAGPSA
jgi:anti-sigma factor RsiW